MHNKERFPPYKVRLFSISRCSINASLTFAEWFNATVGTSTNLNTATLKDKAIY